MLCGIAEPFNLNLPFVELPANSGMDDQLPEGIPVVKGQNFLEFLRFLHSQSRFHGNRQGRLCENPVKKACQTVQIPEHSAALALGNHRARGTACVQVDFGIAQIPAGFRRPEKVLRVVRQHLGDGAKGNAVRFRQLPGLPGSECPVDGGGEEGHVVPVNAAEESVVLPAVNAVRQPLHGGKIVAHKISLPYFTSLSKKDVIANQCRNTGPQ